MNPELAGLFDQHMRPLNRTAHRLGYTFAHWLVAELHERGLHTTGFGPVHADWRLAHFPEGKALLQRCLTPELLLKLLARTFFFGKARTLADFDLCRIVSEAAFVYGLVGTPKLAQVQQDQGIA